MLEINKVYNMECLQGLKLLDSNSIDMVITSPPYFGLRDYGNDNEIGKESSYTDYIDKLLEIFDEIHRVLKAEGSCWVNIGDVYSKGYDIPKQSLMCIPDRFKIEMISRGWICRNEIIWHKPNAMPSSVKTRFNNDYEKMYFFTKSNEYYFETQYEPLKSDLQIHSKRYSRSSKYQDIHQEASVRAGMSRARGENVVALRKNLPERLEFVKFLRSHISVNELADKSSIKKTTIEHWFRKDSVGFSFPNKDDWNTIKHLVDDGSEEFKTIDMQLNDITYETDSILKNLDKGRVKRAVWSISTKAFKGFHYAPYPEELITTPIQACCPEGGIVLDPFMGSGTSGRVAKLLGRNYIGFEINNEYCEVAEERMKVSKPTRLF